MTRYGSQVSAVIVTKGDADLGPILRSLPFADIVVWDNSKEKPDQKVYGRYLAIARAKYEVIYTQDDDCLVDAAGLLQYYDPARVVCNMPMDRRREYSGSGISLVGWGAIFHRSRVDFSPYLEAYPLDDLFLRECDRVFTGLNDCRQVEVKFEHLPSAFGADRMGTEARHGRDLRAIRRRIGLASKIGEVAV